MEESQFQLLQALEAHPQATQRALAGALGISLGKLNYCLKALIDKGYVKYQNFSRNPIKSEYAYLLTAQGIQSKALLTQAFLARKVKEYEELQLQILRLQAQVEKDTNRKREKVDEPLG